MRTLESAILGTILLSSVGFSQDFDRGFYRSHPLGQCERGGNGVMSNISLYTTTFATFSCHLPFYRPWITGFSNDGILQVYTDFSHGGDGYMSCRLAGFDSGGTKRWDTGYRNLPSSAQRYLEFTIPRNPLLGAMKLDCIFSRKSTSSRRRVGVHTIRTFWDFKGRLP